MARSTNRTGITRRMTVLAVVLAVVMLATTVASATPGEQFAGRSRVSVEPINMIFDAAGNATEEKVGFSVLRRSERRLSAFATARGLQPGGVPT